MLKKYHVSKNLFDGLLIGGLFTDANFNVSGNADVYKSIKVFLPAGTYTFSWGKNVNFVRLIIDGNYSQPAYNNISSRTITSTTDGYVGISFRDTTSSSTVWDNTTPIMLNIGSSPEPYEPYGNTWTEIPYRKYTTEADTITSLPTDIIADGQPLSAAIYGNMQQTSGTTNVPSKNVTVANLEASTNYAAFAKADFPDIVVGDSVSIVKGGVTYSQKVMKIDTSYVYIENRTV